MSVVTEGLLCVLTKVLTHSAGQVRKPLYNASINKWKIYEEEFLPMAAMIGKYGPYGEYFTEEQAAKIQQKSFHDAGVVFPPTHPNFQAQF